MATKLEELKMAAEAADAAEADTWAAYWAAHGDAAADDAEAADAAEDDTLAAYAAYYAELKKVQEENPMTKLDELKAAADAAYDAAVAADVRVAAVAADVRAAAVDDEAAIDAAYEAWAAYWDALDDALDAALDAYEAELKKVQEENSDGH
jgi:hypothetical protein